MSSVTVSSCLPLVFFVGAVEGVLEVGLIGTDFAVDAEDILSVEALCPEEAAGAGLTLLDGVEGRPEETRSSAEGTGG